MLLVIYYLINFKKLLKSEKIILVPLFILSFESLDNGIFLSNLYSEYPHFIMVTGLLFFIYWPISYLYFKSINDKFKIKKIYIIYFIPFIYYSTTWFSFFMKTGEEKLQFLTKPNTYSSGDILSRIISYGFMALMIFLMVYEYKKIKTKKYSTIMFLYFNLILSFLSILYYISFVLIYQFKMRDLYSMGFISYQIIFSLPIFLVLGILIVKGYNYYKLKVKNKELPILKDIIETPLKKERKEEKSNDNSNVMDNSEKYQMNKLSEGDAKKYLEKIIKAVEENKLYKDNNFNLTKLSKEINIPTAYISQVLNIYQGETFYNFINKYRIEVSKEMLKNPEFNKKTILSIAYESGFNSKATFNSFFKKTVGMTPSQFRNQDKGEI